MLLATLFMAALAAVAVFIAYRQGQTAAGFRTTWQITAEIFPLLVFALILAGMAQVIVPQELIIRWMGEKSGMKGIWLGTLAGGLCPGGPYVSFPLVLTLLRAGAGVPTVVAFLTSWSLWAVSRLAMEVGFLGWRFVIIRLLSVCFFPVLAGLIARALIKFL